MGGGAQMKRYMEVIYECTHVVMKVEGTGGTPLSYAMCEGGGDR